MRGIGALMSDLLSPGPEEHATLLLRETNHRCANDLQLVVSLLALQSRQAESAETRDALKEAASRVAVLARARTGLSREDQPDLGAALREVCEALHSQAEPRGIVISVKTARDVPKLAPERITTMALAVNELATNAIKHAFHERADGRISVELDRQDALKVVVVSVEDDGLPLCIDASAHGTGMGLGLVARLVNSVGGTFSLPKSGSKRFEIKMHRQPV